MRWSRDLPSAPSSVTVIKDAADRYFASFVVESQPGALAMAEPAIGIDLGLTHFAVLSDGRKIASPRFLRRAEKKIRRAQHALSRKEKGSKNHDKARVKVARMHARVLTHDASSPSAVYGADPRKPSGRAWKTWRSKGSPAPGWPSPCTTPAGQHSSRCWSTRPSGTGESSTGSAGSSPPARWLGLRHEGRPHAVESASGSAGRSPPWLDRDVHAAVNVARAAGLAVTACGAQVRPRSVPAQRGETGTLRVPRKRHGRNPRALRPGRMSIP